MILQASSGFAININLPQWVNVQMYTCAYKQSYGVITICHMFYELKFTSATAVSELPSICVVHIFI